jgi:hypothetical protein
MHSNASVPKGSDLNNAGAKTEMPELMPNNAFVGTKNKSRGLPPWIFHEFSTNMKRRRLKPQPHLQVKP